MWYSVILLASLYVGCRSQSTATMYELASDQRTVHDLEEPLDRDSFDSSYDFIIVGAGAAGSVLASRLTENPNVRVLLIEAGTHEPSVAAVLSQADYLKTSDVDWNFSSEPDANYCLGMVNGRCPIPRGKTMGGTTTINIGIITRGNRRDYDNWAALGNTGWDYNSTLPYFKKLESMNITDFSSDEEYRGFDGPMNVEYGYSYPLDQVFMDAGGENGWPTNVDYNGAQQVGFSRPQFIVKDGARLSSSRGYLHPVRNRPNLHLAKYSLVTKINFETETSVSGVTFEKDGKSFHVEAKKEVLVSAGAIQSPQLLMLSGIGPKEHLSDLGISVKADLPVGENLQDHVGPCGITFETNVTNDYADTDEMIQSWRSERDGPLVTPHVMMSYLDTLNPGDPEGWPDIEFILFPTDNDPEIFKTELGVTEETYDDLYPQPSANHTLWNFFPIAQRPKSRGVILLRDSDPRSAPLIYPRYWSDPEDVQTIIRGVRQIEALANTTAFKALNATLRRNGPRNCTQTFLSDEYIECLCKQVLISFYHYSGTCSMGTVVDEDLKVKGIQKLRVVDASVIPVVPVAHTMVPTYMIAERAADLIKTEYGLLPDKAEHCTEKGALRRSV